MKAEDTKLVEQYGEWSIDFMLKSTENPNIFGIWMRKVATIQMQK